MATADVGTPPVAAERARATSSGGTTSPPSLGALPGEPPKRRVTAAGLARQDAARRAPRQLKEKRGPYHHGDLFEAALSRAQELLLELGPEGLTMSRLARELGVTPPALHYHFRRRGTLLACLADRVGESLRPALYAAANAESSEAGLRAATEAWVALARQKPSAYRLLLREGWFYTAGWSGEMGVELAHCGGQALAGAGPGRARHQAKLPPMPPEWLGRSGNVKDKYYRESVLFPRAMGAEVSEVEARHGWLFTLALMGLGQGAATGFIPEAEVERLRSEMPAMVLAATQAARTSAA